jgi:hypothetical protein
MRTVILMMLTVIPILAADPLKPRDGKLKVGDAAPTFELRQLGAEKSVKLESLKDRPTVLVFGSCT